jgi:hypothetical protein
MAFELKPGQGSLFRNDRRDSDQSPEYKGGINIDGREFWISAWVKTAKTGAKYFSLSAKPKDAASSVRRRPEMDDAIPF